MPALDVSLLADAAFEGELVYVVILMLTDVLSEGSHLLYTDFEELDKKADKLTRMIQNILEDEMIERKLGERKPGLANFLTAAKYYHFGRYERRKEEENDPSDPIARLFNAISASGSRIASHLLNTIRVGFPTAPSSERVVLVTSI